MDTITDPNPEELRTVLGTFATGVVVVTCLSPDGEARAITVNSFTSVSLDPPLVLFCLDKSAFHLERFLGAQTFAISILSGDQADLSNRFARETEDGFEDLATDTLNTGCPVFSGALAALDCRKVAVHEAGDHHVIIGQVSAVLPPSDVDPLLYFAGGYAAIRR